MLPRLGLIVLGTLLVGVLHSETPRLVVSGDEASGTVELAGAGLPGRSHRIEFSGGLDDWWPVFAIRDAESWAWSWPTQGERDGGWFRLVEVVPPAIVAHPSWKSSLELPGDPFLSEPMGGTGGRFEQVEVRWVKFAVMLDALPEVHFQRSSDYPFHYQFARERLAPFLGMTLEEFNAVSQFRSGQGVVLGAILWAPGRNEFGVQLVGQDAYPREMVRFLYETVTSRLTLPEGACGFYMPTYEQTEAARRDGAYLASHGIEVGSPARWIGGSACYSEGWAVGRLVFVEGGEIAAAYARGDLLPTDILLTDGVPAEVPYVAGLITLSPTTPNSHTAILAQSYGIPFVYPRDALEQERVRGMVGRTVVLRTRGYDCEEIAILDVEGLDPVYLSEILALKEPLPLAIEPLARFGAISLAGLDRAMPEDIRYIGGKAANFGFLRRAIPDNSPEAMAFTFDLWSAYLDQAVAGGRTLREEIAARLAGVAWPADIGSLDATLAGIRDLIEGEADFTPAQQSSILAALAGFDSRRKIRFRSSTNVEDSGVFVGAGLYDSYSGCLADDLDGDEVGPSHCDPSQEKERGVFRALRKVYASFYNLNAFIERLRHGVDEREVGMAVLVHYSFPDETEAANGVATSRPSGPNFLYTTMVSQVGAESVTNPSGGSIPEVVEVAGYRPQPGQAGLFQRQRSNRLLLGRDTVMDWERDYQDFATLFLAVTDAYRAHYPQLATVTLEFEYKKLTDGSLVIKQVRRVPEAALRLADGVALVDTPTSLQVYQGEMGDVFSNHRLKSVWRTRTASHWLNPERPEGRVVTEAEIAHAPDGEVVTDRGNPSEWPGAVQDVLVEFGNTFARDRWHWASQGGDTEYELRVKMPMGSAYQRDPIYALGDFEVWFQANYEDPLPWIDWQGLPDRRRTDTVFLERGSPDDPLPEGAVKVERSFRNRNGVAVRTSFYWPPPPTGVVAGYTAPLEKWIGTTLTGVLPEPVELTGYYSQTYRPGHHNFTEEFLFEPQLDPGVPAGVRAGLEARNIRMIYFFTSGGPNDVLKAVGYDGTIRDL